METEKLSPSQQEAFLSLLDDTSVTVRKALVAHFTRLGPPALHFLQDTTHSTNRIIARYAAWYLDELKFGDPVAEFRGFIRSLNYELETGSLLLARTVNAGLDIGACCTALDAIARRCLELIIEPATPREKCRVINRVLFHEWGFHGNLEHYTDPSNSLIDRVLERRKGIPLSLCTVYVLVAGRIGLELEPVGVPGHFFVGCFLEDTPFFVDAFDKGVFRDAGEIFDSLRSNNIAPKTSDLAPTPVREVLCRNCRNLVNHYQAASDAAHARLFAGFVEEFETTYERHTT